MPKPNVVFLLTDQWRLQALGYSGNAQAPPAIEHESEQGRTNQRQTVG